MRIIGKRYVLHGLDCSSIPCSPPSSLEFFKMTMYTPPRRDSIYLDASLAGHPNPFSLPIRYLAVVGNDVEGQFFHYRLSLVSVASDGAEQAIRINPVPDSRAANPMDCVALVDYIPYAFTRDPGLPPFLCPVRQNPKITAGQILYRIFDHYEMDKYVFQQPGVGCRHWCASVLAMLGQDGFVPGNVSQVFRTFEVQANAQLGPRIPMPRIRGTFTSPFLTLPE